MIGPSGLVCVEIKEFGNLPLPIFVNKKTGEPLRDQKLLKKLRRFMNWREAMPGLIQNPQDFITEYDSNDFEQVKDVVEVWFDSGSTHSYVLELENLHWPTRCITRIRPT